MNRAKSVFIGVYPMIAMAIVGYSVWQLSVTRDNFAWAGPVLTSLPFMAFLSYIMAFKSVARTSGSFPVLNLVALGGSVLAGYAVRAVGQIQLPWRSLSRARFDLRSTASGTPGWGGPRRAGWRWGAPSLRSN